MRRLRAKLTSPRGRALAVLLAGVLAALLAAWGQRHHNQQQAQAAFARAAARTADQLMLRLQTYEYGLRGARGAVLAAGNDAITRERFRIYQASRDLAREFPGARGFGFVRRVPAADTAAWLAATRRDGAPGLALQQIAAHDGERYVIQFIEPAENNRQALGLDIASEPARRAAALQALRSGQATITAPITLVQASGHPAQGFLVLLPVYRPGAQSGLPAAAGVRADDAVGWSYVALLAGEVLQAVDLHADELRLMLEDLPPGAAPQRFHVTGQALLDEPGLPQLALLRPVFGRQWRITVQATPLFVARLNLLSPALVLALGLAGSGLLASLAFARALNQRRGAEIEAQHVAAEQQLRAFNSTLGQQVAERTAQLESARHDLQTILDAMPSMLGYWDRQLINRFANRAYHRWFGVDPGAMPGSHIRDLLGPVLFESNRPFMEAALRGEPQTFERSIPSPDGHGARHSLAHYLPDVVDGQVQGFYVLVHDVTELNEGRRRLADSEAFLERAGRVAGVGGWQLVLATGEITWTAETRRIHEMEQGYQPQLDQGLDFYAPEARPVIAAAVQAAIAHGTPWDLELPFNTAKGRAIWVRTVGEAQHAPGAAPGAPPLRLVGAFQDITARRQAEQAVRRLAAAEAASAAKSAFLATVSHELRTPLNAVIGLAHLLDDTALDANQRDLVHKLGIAGRALLGVISDVLDLSRIEAGDLDLAPQPFCLADLMDELVAMLAPQAEAKRLGLILVPLPALPRLLVGDAGRLRQVLTNLLANAIKFTDRGQVVLRVDLLQSDAEQVLLRCAVTDTGIGIPHEAQGRLFTPFMQVDGSASRRHGGTGLGLSIVRRLVALMGGEVGVHSVPGQGSSFWFTVTLHTLPGQPHALTARPPPALALPVPQPAWPGQGQGLAGLRLMVVDDSVLNLEVASRLLVREGAEVITCDSGAQALQRLLELPWPGLDAVLMDVQMPGMDGCETTRRLRRLPGLAGLPVVAVTAGVTPAERQRALSAGMSDFITKPLQPAALVRTLAGLVAHARSGLGGAHSAAALARPGGMAAVPDVSDAPVVPDAHQAPFLDLAIDGLDPRLATLGRVGDEPLLARVLAQLFTEFGAWGVPGDPGAQSVQSSAVSPGAALDQPALAAHLHLLHRLHRLRGHAGLLGAHRVLAEANTAEALLRQQAEPATWQAALADVQAALDQLRQASAPWLALQQAQAASAAAGPALLEAEALAEWRTALRRNDLSALAMHAQWRPALQAWLGEPAAQRLAEALARLDFAQALACLPAADATASWP